MLKRFHPVSIVLCLILIVGCAANHSLTDFNKQLANDVEKADATAAAKPETPSIVPVNPRIIEAELWLQISDIQVLSGNSLRKHNTSRGIPPEAPPQLYVWSSEIARRNNQVVLDLGIKGPMPQDIFTDTENGNQIYFWNLSQLLGNQDTIKIVRNVKVEAFELYTLLNTSNYLAYDFSSEEYQFYTKAEPFIELTQEVKDTAFKIAGNEPNPFKKARLIFEWVNKNMSYQYPPPQRGAAAALQTLRGDNGQYSFLFIALCRAVGVPARFVSGFQVSDSANLRYHTWAEFFLPNNGWLPADPTHDLSQFGKLNNKRIVASVGTNILLKNVPFWATYSNGEVENSRTPFMQLATIVYTGIKAKFKSGITTIRFEKKQDDGAVTQK